MIDILILLAITLILTLEINILRFSLYRPTSFMQRETLIVDSYRWNQTRTSKALSNKCDAEG